ncbi:serine protease [Anaerolineales bacterium HSG6]|nr:serine protease [Anaerolineales bacterium HSG6]
MSNLDEKLMNATGAVIIEGEIIGTAWLFSDGYLLTAAHVLCRDVDHDTGEHKGLYDEVQIQFGSFAPRPAQRYHLDFQPEKGIDFAILKMDVNELPRNCLPLPIACVESLHAKSEIKAYGYGETVGYPTTGNGTYSGLANVVVQK